MNSLPGSGFGSSPLARGLPETKSSEIISIWDHPRSRGVYPGPGAVEAPGTGSSPLARGLRLSLRLPDVSPRIIPARAGFTPLATVTLTGTNGSSPLARGLPPGLGLAGDLDRIIPARAGFTLRGGARGHLRWDHPRSRGVYAANAASTAASSGSSPLARGLRVDVPGDGVEFRIIPARAGFTIPARRGR